MPSPFPGMDPFLEAEALWPRFHHQLVNCLYQVLLPGLVDRYRARVSQRAYVTEFPLFTSIIREEHLEEFLEIRQRADERLVTLIDVVSPANKLHGEGRQRYHEVRKVARAQGASVVEIDLSLQGTPMLDYSRDALPPWDYVVTVTRSSQPDRYEIYHTTLGARLPRFKIPLAPDDRDTVLDLQSTFARCYDTGNFATMVDYRQEPAVRLGERNARYVDELLKQLKIR